MRDMVVSQELVNKEGGSFSLGKVSVREIPERSLSRYWLIDTFCGEILIKERDEERSVTCIDESSFDFDLTRVQ
jgi:hypothetical protein